MTDHKRKKIAVVGGTRGVGLALVSLVLQENFDVTLLARNPQKVSLKDERLEVVAGDVRDYQAVVSLVKGHDAICSCIGVPITFKAVDLFSVAARNITSALGEHPGTKYIAVTGIGAGDSKGHGGFLYDSIFKPLLLRTIYEDKDREEDIICESNTEWMIVRPAGLTNGSRTGNYRTIIDLQGVTAKRISRLDVADFIVKQLVVPTCFGKSVLLTY